MAKFYFNLKKYRDELVKEKISHDMVNLLLENDKKYSGKEVKFFSNLDTWGIIKDDKVLIRKEWCTKKENKFMQLLYGLFTQYTL